ncbi:hypothetical protein TNCV_332181 [Trichonephila clavipes]|nr:hypothetical protein TNCV_332181 [Trichonephila clavipes]
MLLSHHETPKSSVLLCRFFDSKIHVGKLWAVIFEAAVPCKSVEGIPRRIGSVIVVPCPMYRIVVAHSQALRSVPENSQEVTDE